MLKADDNDDHRNVQQPVNERNVNLPGLHFRGMDNAHRRQIAQTHCLTGQEKTPEITAREAITVASVAIISIGISAHSGASRKNGF